MSPLWRSQETKKVSVEEPSSLIRISEVKVLKRLRSRLGDLGPLKESMKQIGLLQPIGITKDNVLVYGHRRLEAAKSLGWKEIPYVLVKLDESQQKLAEFEENLKRSDMAWQDVVKAKAELHKLHQKIHGEPKTGYRSDLKEPLSESEKGWGLKDTAELLGESIGLVSQDIKLAEALEKDPSLSKALNKSSALRQLEELGRKIKIRTWKCDLCEEEFSGKKRKRKLELCPPCYAQAKPFHKIRVPDETKPKTGKISFAKLMSDKVKL